MFSCGSESLSRPIEKFICRIADVYGRKVTPEAEGPLLFDVVLFEPEIPPTRATSSGCAPTRVPVCISSNRWDFFSTISSSAGPNSITAPAEVRLHANWRECVEALSGKRVFAVTTQGATRYDLPRYQRGDVFVLGPETRGLQAEILEAFPPEMRIKLPMREGCRSLNLSNAVAIAVYEAWRQLNSSKT